MTDQTLRRLSERTVTIANAGALAEAALQLNGVFADVDRAAAQYLENLRPLRGQTGEIPPKTEQECTGRG